MVEAVATASEGLNLKSDNQEERLNANNRKSAEEKRRGTSPELDHFLPKHKYPLFSMSAYNLVPSCKICNQSLKGEIEFNYEEFYSPFEEGIEESFRFYRRMINQEATQQDSKIVEATTVQNIPNYVNSILGISNDFTISIKYEERPGITEKENLKFKKKVENKII